jgi:hypothetical protein
VHAKLLLPSFSRSFSNPGEFSLVFFTNWTCIPGLYNHYVFSPQLCMLLQYQSMLAHTQACSWNVHTSPGTISYIHEQLLSFPRLQNLKTTTPPRLKICDTNFSHTTYTKVCIKSIYWLMTFVTNLQIVFRVRHSKHVESIPERSSSESTSQVCQAVDAALVWFGGYSIYWSRCK